MENWLGVELRHLAALSAIHEERSFRGAADRLGYVQSAVSQQISQLETLVGELLVHRTRGHAPPVRLTEAGLLLLEHASRILGQLDAAQADLRSLNAVGAHTLRVGVEQGVAMRLVPSVLRRVAQQLPHVEVLLEEASCDRAHLARVEHGELDAAFAELPLGDGPLAYTEVLVDPCVLVVAADNPLALSNAPMELSSLVAEPLVAMTGWPLMELIELQLRSAGLEPRFAMRTDSAATAQALAGAGVGAAILPRLAVDLGDPRVVALELGELLPARRLALYWHEGRRNTADVEAFRDIVLAVARMVVRPDPPALVDVPPPVALAG